MKKLNNVTKILLIILAIAVSYFIILLMLRPFLTTQPTSMTEMMSRVMRGDATSNLMSLVSLIIALVIGTIISFYLFVERDKTSENRDYQLIRKALSEDEKRILDEIKKTDEITQDSLRFRLNWSKAKISTILTNLDRKGLVQRERTGKTYNVYLQKV